jgi:CubicO group peptidase (beta-lactamase class C family)
MHATGVYVNASPPSGMAHGYEYADEKLKSALDWDMSWAGGAGALYSTVGDLYLWNEALYGGKLLSDDDFKAATTPVALPPNVDGLSYGFGLVISRVSRLPAIGHGGGLNGWSSDLVRLPEQKCTVVVLGNTQPPPPRLVTAAISRALLDKYLEAEIQKLPPPDEDESVDPKSFQDYVGRYDYQTAIMTVTVREDGLFAQLTDQPENQVFPKAKDEFFWKVVDAEVRFLRHDDTMQVVAAQHRQGGRVFRAPKLEENVNLTEDQAELLVGKYRYGLLATMTVTRDGTQLFAQLTGQPRFPIFPKSETEFEWHIVEASVKFEIGDDGKVTKAVHTQNDTTFDAPKIE